MTPTLLLSYPLARARPCLVWYLPTGYGSNGRVGVAYACPSRLLARQVANVAVREGVPIVTLIGKHASRSTADKATYESAEAIAVTHLQHGLQQQPQARSTRPSAVRRCACR